ncbi:MAG: hypothetical protein EOP48_13410 [Sphingobacteriales bacterium]|nr:MAG: hypothetical protein EOP48_13410 [Sphingobacteriales bacterium]
MASETNFLWIPVEAKLLAPGNIGGEMRTYPYFNKDDEKEIIGFEIDNIYISVSSIVRLLMKNSKISELTRNRTLLLSNECHVNFRFYDTEYVVWEPFGDNSRYFIAPIKGRGPEDQIREIECMFVDYQPNPIRLIFGNLLTLKHITRLFDKIR